MSHRYPEAEAPGPEWVLGLTSKDLLVTDGMGSWLTGSTGGAPACYESHL